MRSSKSALLVLLSIVATGLVEGGNVEGKLSFEKRNPFAGLVYLANVNDGGPELCGSLDQKDKAFSDMLVVGKSGCDVTFHNSDDTDHNIFANDLESGVNFDVGLIPPGGDASTAVDWREGHLVRVGCKIHPKMTSYIANVPSKAYTIVEFEDGKLDTSFLLSDVPDGGVDLEIVLIPLDRISVRLEHGESKTVNVTYKDKVFGTLTLSH